MKNLVSSRAKRAAILGGTLVLTIGLAMLGTSVAAQGSARSSGTTQLLSQPSGQVPPNDIDHFTCYIAKTTATAVPQFNSPAAVELSDQFAPQGFLVGLGRLVLHCNPTEKFVAGAPVTPIVNPLTHLACFSVQATPATTSVQPSFSVQVKNQFGTGTLVTGQPVLFCLPSWKNLTAATALSQPPGLDHYTCYSVANAANMPPPPSPVGLQDQFNKVVRGQQTTTETTLGPPNLFCLPTLKTLSPLAGPEPPTLFHPLDHLTCYPVVAETGAGKPAGGRVTDQNQFGAGLVKIGSLRELCVPSLKTVDNSTGTLVIHKLGVDPASGVGIPLSGATFSVNPGGQTCTTDASGTCSITGLATPGTYTVHEVTPPPGYGPGPDQTVTFSGGPQTINVVFTDVPGTQGSNTIDITKLAGNTSAPVPLAGATFTATPKVASNPSGTCTTTATGTCQITGLATDTYTVTETVAPPGYGPGPAQTVTFTTPPQTISLTFNDVPSATPDSNILAIDKVGSSPSAGNVPLPGATFTATPSIASNPSGTCTTNAAGTCQITGLATDTYTVTETTVPSGYSGAATQTVTFTTSPEALNASFVDTAVPGG